MISTLLRLSLKIYNFLNKFKFKVNLFTNVLGLMFPLCSFRKSFFANRGEIACRIIETCKDMGIKTVGVYDKDDSHESHVSKVDAIVCIEPTKSRAKYLALV